MLVIYMLVDRELNVYNKYFHQICITMNIKRIILITFIFGESCERVQLSIGAGRIKQCRVDKRIGIQNSKRLR